MDAQFGPYLPVPFCAGAEAIAIPNTQNKPGKKGERESDKVGQPCFFPDPAQEIKNDQG